MRYAPTAYTAVGLAELVYEPEIAIGRPVVPKLPSAQRRVWPSGSCQHEQASLSAGYVPPGATVWTESTA